MTIAAIYARTSTGLRILLVLLCLLTLATSASAECAWVLWMEAPVHSKQWSLRYPYDSPAFETKKECDRAAQHAEAVQTSGLTDATKRGLPLEPRSWYVCLPDTVDPRGPKGK